MQVVSSQLQTIIDKWGNKPLPDNYIFPYMKGHETAIERKAIVRELSSESQTYEVDR